MGTEKYVQNLDFERFDCPYEKSRFHFPLSFILWQQFKRPVNFVTRRSVYQNDLKHFLDTESVLLHTQVEESDNDDAPFAPGMPNNDVISCYLYKNNAIRVSTRTDGLLTLSFYFPLGEKCVEGEFKKWIQTEKKSKIGLITKACDDIEIRPFYIEAPQIGDLELNYGPGFDSIHKRLITKLSEKKSSLFLFHGPSGTGKSTYIKYLTSLIDREWIYVPVNLANSLDSPEFMNLLLSHKNAVLILEDAEKAVQARSNSENSSVAALLNLSDGILGNLLNIAFIVTYNAEKQAIDQALLRKGRLTVEHDFGPLPVEQARTLAKNLGRDIEITEPCTLAEIYGSEEVTGHIPEPAKRAGFGAIKA